ncbi:glycine--tRNA ligase subunit beta [Enterobacteriaceae endosymbiont of Neohaemonia nigricornis]|uniref:glycine--tRNA ligase subunit beta n=1 Tax=Enterobacteriaceae endosymbiont of Neohaemonia nigricornis TaxID=2675792 RepID=UPI001449020A|nr:glycine--tRNA ligase subunit beta [Enterobacteriaceae endosymbiont of Neohaemonia nigricornis]QJC30258.1 glycine--tRNA ligase subunit beta [Enterobacteriaceae endosymbiont of Neohaemonia nigricornis]
MKKVTFLLELSIEDIPSYLLLQITNIIKTNFIYELNKYNFKYKIINAFMTNRRIALQIHNFDVIQKDYYINIKGPYVKIKDEQNFKNKQIKFWMIKHKIKDFNNIKFHKNYIIYKKHIQGLHIKNFLPQILKDTLLNISSIPNTMYWNDNNFKFIRPIRNLLVLLDDIFIPINILNIPSNNVIQGHRFIGEQKIYLLHAKQYETTLFNTGKVIVDFIKRKNKILKDINNIINKIHGIIKLSSNLLDELTAMIEWPVILIGKFNLKFLKLPHKILIHIMEKYQKYIPIYDDNKILLPYFIFIINIESNNTHKIVQRHEQVLNAKFQDINFFLKNDMNMQLEQYVNKLKYIVFHKKLGSLYDKTMRIIKISEYLALKLKHTVTHFLRTSLLYKCDLATQMVYEFADLSGVVGMYYAIKDKEHNVVSKALYDQYRYNICYKIPTNKVSYILFISDNIDTLVGMFSVGLLPTGDKDPYTLKKNTLTIIHIMIKNKLDINLKKLINFNIKKYNYVDDKNILINNLMQFILNRCKNWYLSLGYQIKIINAVILNNYKYHYKLFILDFIIKAVNKFFLIEKKQSKLLLITYKRINKILITNQQNISNHINMKLILEKEEQILINHLKKLSKIIKNKILNHEYYNILLILSELYYPVNKFFQNIIINSNNIAIKNNRVTILHNIEKYLLQIVNLNKLN